MCDYYNVCASQVKAITFNTSTNDEKKQNFFSWWEKNIRESCECIHLATVKVCSKLSSHFPFSDSTVKIRKLLMMTMMLADDELLDELYYNSVNLKEVVRKDAEY